MKLIRIIKENMKQQKYSMFFFLIYALFSIFLLVLNLISTKLQNYLSILITIGIVVVFMKFNKKLCKNKYLVVISFLIPLLFRAALLFLEYGNLEGDYLTFFSNAENYAKGASLNNEYISLFPFLYSYIALLGQVFKMFGNGYIICVMMNLVIEMVGVFFFYKILNNKFGNTKARIGTLFYLYNPFNILWITKCCPVTVVNTLLIITFFMFLRIDFKKRDFWFWSFLTGIFVGLTNSFRPFMIVYIIALIIYFISLLKKVSWVKLLCSFATILACLSLTNTFILNKAENQIGIRLEGYQSGFSIFVGSNVQGHGMWNLQDSEFFYEKVKELGRVEAHREVKRLAIERYKNNGINNIWFLGYKAGILGRNLDNYTYIDIFNSVKDNLSTWVLLVIKVYLSTYLYCLLFMNLISSIKIIRTPYLINNYNYLGIFGMGLFAAMLLLEVSPRYFIPITIPIIFISILSLFKEEKVFD